VLFKTALQIAANRELLDSQESELATWRRVFAEEVRTAVRRVDAIDAIAAIRRAGILD
jgi:glycerol-3-phosphate O-acyltransferase